MLPRFLPFGDPMARENLPTLVTDLKARMKNIRDSL
jgi:hypothetical protein